MKHILISVVLLEFTSYEYCRTNEKSKGLNYRFKISSITKIIGKKHLLNFWKCLYKNDLNYFF